MRAYAGLFILSAVLLGACAREEASVYPYRWVYVSKNPARQSDVEEIRQIVKTASEHGLNGMYFSAGFDRLDLQPPEYFQGLEEIKKICSSYGVEIIPRCLDVGYNGSVLAHNKNLAAGIPVSGQLFVVKAGEARLQADPPVSMVNGGFEKYAKDRIDGFRFPAKVGEVVFVDREVFTGGKASLRFENLGDYPDDPGRLIQEVTVHPERLYRLSFQVKTEGLDPSDSFGSGRFRVQVRGLRDGRQLTYFDPRVRSTGDWRQVTVGFNSKDYDQVEVCVGVWEGKTGKFWLDEMRLEEIGLVNLLRRPGTPLTVQGEKNGIIYEEGRDYAPVADPELDFRFDHDGPVIEVLPGGRISEGERLRVSYYHGITVYQSQVTACMSEPELYEIWRSAVRLIDKNLSPAKYFLSVDEVRAGGTCKACTERGMTMGQILGDCITRQAEIVREVNPRAELFIWSDMLDPNHNAGERQGNYYYHVDGTFQGSWENIPKDLVIGCWWHEKRYESLGHFSGLGFRTMACGYYDADNLDNDRTWLEALDATGGACGIMYTTWLDKYELLGEFGDLVSGPRENKQP
ncbi:MAG: hypothetical protein JXQ83_14395 [Candidatus Glassbacteria bacterium]|nr:hypothetical protein [Candidatus Glassbacteria bacterium]